MKKSTKGALAAGAAAVLLLGGVGSLAFWTDTDEIDGGTIDSGSLTLETGECDPSWLDAQGDEAITLLVPGDSVYKECEVTLDGSGDNLLATVEIDPADINDETIGDPADELLVDATITDPVFDAAGVPVDGPTPVTVRITVDWEFGDENNGSQLSTATLDDLTLTATQVDPSP